MKSYLMSKTTIIISLISTMFEFTDCNFFPNFATPTLDQSEALEEIALAKQPSHHTLSTLSNEESSFHSQTQTHSSLKKQFASKTSENHNMVKQLVTTMKQMVGKFIEDIGCSYNSRKIISQTWKVLEKNKSPNKQTLKAMFDREVNRKLAEKVGLGPTLARYGAFEFLNAMEELRIDLVLRMRTESVKSHLFNRSIQRKERLAAYVQYFVEEELKKGCVSARFNEAAGRRMKKILESNKTQADFIDYYLGNSNEVFERFASTQVAF